MECTKCTSYEQILANKEEIAYLKRQVQKYQFDNLTGLKLRTDFEDDFFSRFQQKEPFCLIVIDLDNLKDINENLGYLEGDKAIKNIGHYLSDNILGECYRIGGDEFAILTYSCKDISKLSLLTNVSYVKIQADYNKHKSTRDLFSEADEILHIVKKGKRKSVK